MEAFFEGSHPVYEGAQEDYSSQSIIIREKQGSSAATNGAFVASDWLIQNTGEGSALKDDLEFFGLGKTPSSDGNQEMLAATGEIRLAFTDGTNMTH